MESTVSQILAKHFREVFFGGNWTVSNVKERLAYVTWQQATTEVYSLNSIAKLTFHIGYFVSAIHRVHQGRAIDAHDKYSFNVPDIKSQEEWEQLVSKVLTQAEQVAALIEKLPDNRLTEVFVDKKYGTYYRNLQGVTEHTHYHLGQIALIKKILTQDKS